MSSIGEDIDNTHTTSDVGTDLEISYEEGLLTSNIKQTIANFPKDVLLNILQFIPLCELHFGRIPKVSLSWLKAALRVEHDRYWSKPGAVTAYDNTLLDVRTGDVIHNLNDLNAMRVMFNMWSPDQRQRTITYDKVPFQYQNLDGRRHSVAPPTQATTAAEGCRSHAMPIAPHDMNGVGYTLLNSVYLCLHDCRYLYVLLGNNVTCVDLMMNKVKWSNVLFDQANRYLFVNKFIQTSDYIYVTTSQNLRVFAKKDGYRTELILPNMINRKKGEVIRDVVATNNFVAILYADNIVYRREHDFAHYHHEQYHELIINQIADTRDSTLMTVGALEPPKLYLYDSSFNLQIAATLKQKDRYEFSYVFNDCFSIMNDQLFELRVIDGVSGGRKHIIDLSKDLTIDDRTEFSQCDQYLLMGRDKSWYLLDPYNNTCQDCFQFGHFDRLYLHSCPDQLHMVGLRGDQIFYFPSREQQVYKWITLFTKMKNNFYQYESDHSHTKLFQGQGNVLIMSRSVSDTRRFLSSQQRLDVDLSAFDVRDGKLLWQVVHECYYGGAERSEKGFHVVIDDTNRCVLVFSYFVPMFAVKRGMSLCSAYCIDSGRLKWKYQHKHKPGLMYVDTTTGDDESSQDANSGLTISRKASTDTMSNSSLGYEENALSPKAKHVKNKKNKCKTQ
ncbi:hypothetical protein AKO1_012262 [Acrasis kona]|uniref:F-box domain-containing protein n=1 Tax=Acrasis kona TaxID=1008807 RepID=A0AAW2ZBP8_9EUKA